MFRRSQNTTNNTIDEPAQAFDRFFNSKDFRDMVKQSDNDQKRMIRQADKIEKTQKRAARNSQNPTKTAPTPKKKGSKPKNRQA